MYPFATSLTIISPSSRCLIVKTHTEDIGRIPIKRYSSVPHIIQFMAFPCGSLTFNMDLDQAYGMT